MLPFILDIMSPGPWPVQYYVLNHYLRLPSVLDQSDALKPLSLRD
jgi:hypothetical protein